jgi:hypothetical protein
MYGGVTEEQCTGEKTEATKFNIFLKCQAGNQVEQKWKRLITVRSILHL